MNKILVAFLGAFVFAASVFGGATLSITVKPGDSYTHSILFFKMGPQMAIWLEDITGKNAGTIYVTKYSATTYGMKKTPRPSSLPVWRFKGIDPSAPDKKTDAQSGSATAVDAITAATPQQEFARQWKVPADLAPGSYSLFAEVNNSFDYNETFQKGLPKTAPNFSDVNGQPSIVWKATVVVGDLPSMGPLTIAGHGQVRGENGAIDTAMAAVTTAKTIISEINFSFEP